AEGRIRKAVILDCDVHQGDGTASILKDDPSIFTLSIHGERNYPFRKEESDLDVALESGAGDDVYLDAVRRGVGTALDRAHADLAIYLAGADPYSGDRLGKLDVSGAGLAERDRVVLDACARHGVPVAVVMAGGYARDIEETVGIQSATVRLVAARHAGGRS
ncbi:MAG: histone deacetylase, partial [Acidobacteriota bacterium]|nr:histone deacetylase [Acidobacteriota bacterium]